MEQKDYEVAMVRARLKKIRYQSTELLARFASMEETDLPAWLQAKVSDADHFISAVYDYFQYGDYEEDTEEEEKNDMEEESIDILRPPSHVLVVRDDELDIEEVDMLPPSAMMAMGERNAIEKREESKNNLSKHQGVDEETWEDENKGNSKIS
jgi:hypothetical protein